MNAKMLRLGGYALMGSGTSYIIIVLIYAISLSRLKISSLGHMQITQSVVSTYANNPTPFRLINILFVLFGVFIALAVLAVRLFFKDEPKVKNYINIALLAGTVSSGMFVAGGMVGLAGLPGVAALRDVSAFRAINSLSTSLAGTGTFATGWLLFIFGYAGFTTKKLPKLLCFVLMIDGIVDVFELYVPFFIKVDAALAIIYSFWLGSILLKAKISE